MIDIENFRIQPPTTRRMRVTYFLNAEQQKLAIQVGVERNRACKASGTMNHRISNQDDEQMNIEGVAAEIAWFQYHGLMPDLTTTLPSPDHDGVWNGLLVDVKSTKYPNGKMISALKSRTKRVDVYGFCAGVFPWYQVVGHMMTGDFINDAHIGDLGYGPTYIANRYEPKFVPYFKEVPA